MAAFSPFSRAAAKKAPFIAGVVIIVLAIIGLVNVVGWVSGVVSPGNKKSNDSVLKLRKKC